MKTSEILWKIAVYLFYILIISSLSCLIGYLFDNNVIIQISFAVVYLSFMGSLSLAIVSTLISQYGD